MKIYFAGSIRGGRADQGLYSQIIQMLSTYGQVLTEHIGNPQLTLLGEDQKTAGYIHKRDVRWLHEADIVIAEVSTPSLGVGYEIALAESLGKKILCIFRPQQKRRLSAMIAGNVSLQVVEYQTMEDLKKLFQKYFSK